MYAHLYACICPTAKAQLTSINVDESNAQLRTAGLITPNQRSANLITAHTHAKRIITQQDKTLLLTIQVIGHQHQGQQRKLKQRR